MKKILIFLFLICFNISYADNITSSWNTSTWETSELITIEEPKIEDIWKYFDLEKEINLLFKKNIIINSTLEIDLSNIEQNLLNFFPEDNFSYEWAINWINNWKDKFFSTKFSDKWTKEIGLNIIKNENIDWNIIQKPFFSTKINILVYEKSIPIIISKDTNKAELDSYIQTSKLNWIYLYQIWPLTKTDLEVTNIYTSIEKYTKIDWLKTDYLVIRWWRDFMFDVLSKINREFTIWWEENILKMKIVWISPYNLEVLNKYLKNFLSWKKWIADMILLWENSRFSIFNDNTFSLLLSNLKENKYNYLQIELKDKTVNNFLFLSKFVNNLSNIWYTNDDIYIFLIIPLILLIIISFKHIIGFSPIWLILPLSITLIMIKLWWELWLFLLFSFLILNFLLSFLISKLNLLYAPKMAFLVSLNIILCIIVINILQSLDLIILNFWDILFFILFIIVNERFINIIVSKDLLEYKSSFVYTVFISIVSFYLININMLKIWLLAYPEIVLIIIPLQFIIWRFTWLRVTEYFRFKEIIKSIEEE